MYGTAIMAGSLALASAWAGWTLNAMYMGERVQAMKTEMAELKTEYATKQAQAVEKAHAETIRLQTQADEAARKSAARQAKMADDLRRSDTALGLLHSAADTAISAAQDSFAACQSNAAALAVVSTECGSAVNSLARDAQGWFNESVMLRDAWPK